MSVSMSMSAVPPSCVPETREVCSLPTLPPSQAGTGFSTAKEGTPGVLIVSPVCPNLMNLSRVLNPSKTGFN